MVLLISLHWKSPWDVLGLQGQFRVWRIYKAYRIYFNKHDKWFQWKYVLFPYLCVIWCHFSGWSAKPISLVEDNCEYVGKYVRHMHEISLLWLARVTTCCCWIDHLICDWIVIWQYVNSKFFWNKVWQCYC